MNQDLKTLTRDLTLKEGTFWKLYFAYGNGTKAALEAYDTNNYATASVIASENFRKHKNIRQAYMESKGISLGKLVEKIEQGLEATKTSNAAILVLQDGKTVKAEEQGLIEVPDYATRHRYVETAAKWLDIQKEDILPNEGGGNQYNFFTLTYDQLCAITNKTTTSELREEEFVDVLIEGNLQGEEQEVSMGVHTP